jgi:hypothetical protein
MYFTVKIAKNSRKSKRRLVVAVTALMMAGVSQSSSFALNNDYTNNNTASGNWSSYLNWSAGRTPISTDNVRVLSGGPAVPSIEYLNGDFSVANIVINASTFSSLEASSLGTIGRTLTLNGTTSTALIDIGTNNTGDVYIGGTTGAPGQISVDLEQPSTYHNQINVESSGARLLFDSSIIGTGGITKIGPGDLDLGLPFSGFSTALNTFSGGVTLSAGTLTLDQSSTTSGGTIVNSPLGTGALNITGGYLNASSAVTIANNVVISSGNLSPSYCQMSWMKPEP